MHSLSVIKMHSLSVIKMHSLPFIKMHSLSVIKMHSLSVIKMHSLSVIKMHSLSVIKMHSLSVTCRQYSPYVWPSRCPNKMQKILAIGISSYFHRCTYQKASLCWPPLAEYYFSDESFSIQQLPPSSDSKLPYFFYFKKVFECNFNTYLLTPWSRVLLEKLTSKLCS